MDRKISVNFTRAGLISAASSIEGVITASSFMKVERRVLGNQKRKQRRKDQGEIFTTSPALAIHFCDSLTRQACGRRIRILLDHLIERGPSLGKILQLVIAI